MLNAITTFLFTCSPQIKNHSLQLCPKVINYKGTGTARKVIVETV